MFSYLSMPIGWWELAKRTISELRRDRALGLAAELAYYFFLGLFPALLFLVALMAYLPIEGSVGQIMRLLDPVLPPQMLDVVRDQLTRLSRNPRGGLLSLGLLGALWTSSAALVALINALNRAYDIKEGRAWWHRRLLAIVLTIGLAFFILVSFALVVIGPQIAGYLSSELGMAAAFKWAWYILQWPLAFVLVATGISLVYYFAPDAEQDWLWMSPGSLVAAVLWLLGSLGFRFYVTNFSSYEQTYGVIGAVILLLLWFYLSGFVLLIGAEINAVIEKASPHATKVSHGRRRVIGPRAERQYRRNRAGDERPRPVPGVVHERERARGDRIPE